MIVLDDEAFISIDGPLDGAEAPALQRSVDDARRMGIRRLVVDLANVSSIDEHGVSALAAAATVVRRGLVLLMPDGAVATVDDADSLRALLKVSRADPRG
ncbi:MAG: STAS domain-containing protein [Actinobacteria bacterium]|nr:STAS domain-containing protein [Actinomycetota bacterium]